ncbi:MAG: site-specific integrase [Planctomycetaceae bacterium]|nr:site-specific integrase [Planctomycetaceae bacterium]
MTDREPTENERANARKRSRRGHNEGTIYQTNDGRWRGSVSLGYGIDGKLNRKYVSGKTRAEVSRKITQLLNQQQRGVPIANAAPTVAVFLDQWLQDAVKPHVRQRTYDAYESHVRVHLVPALGRHKLDKLTPAMVTAMLAEKRASGVSGAMLVKIRSTLRNALNEAMRLELVSRNVAALTRAPATEPFEPKPMTPDELTRFLAAAKGDRFEALFVTAVWLGMREGELLGLRWQDIDFEAKTLTVAMQLQWSNSKPKTPMLVEPKTERSRRRVPLPTPVARALIEHRTRHLEYKLEHRRIWKGDTWGLVFTTTTGTPIDASNLTKAYRATLERAGVDRRRFHDLRHSTGTFLTAKNVHPRVIMQILGHSQISTTMNTYAHVELDTMRDALDSLSELMEGA